MYGDFGHFDQSGYRTDGRAARPGHGNGVGDPASLRVSDADRDLAAAELGEHFQAGRLTQDEFDERVGKAINARTRGDLDELLADLPVERPAAALPSPVPAARVAHRMRWAMPVLLLAWAAILFAATGPHAHGGVTPIVPILLAFTALRLLLRRGRRPGRWR
jgi:Domain of unknown function (DUF1707)